MNRTTWKQWIVKHDTKNNVILTLLREVEALIVRMIRGIALFMWEGLWQWLRDVLAWLHETIVLCVRIAVRFVRVAAVFAVWVVLVFGPLAFHFGFISGIWTVLALVGSAWGLRRQLKKRRAGNAK